MVNGSLIHRADNRGPNSGQRGRPEMNDHDEHDPNAADAARSRPTPDDESDMTAADGGNRLVVRGSGEAAPAGLPAVLPPPCWENASGRASGASGIGAIRLRAAAAAAIGLGVVALVAAGYAAIDHHSQAGLLAERAQENARLAQTVSALNARLQAVENAKGRDELAELRRSVGDIKTAAVTSRELGAAIAQLSQRVEKLDREQGAKLDRLGERVERETSARAAQLSPHPDKAEKQPAPASPPPALPSPKFAGDVSMDPTGSIERPRQVLRGYVVLGAHDDVALIGGRYGERAVRPGDFLPGAGRIERVERQGANWIVVTERGLIASAYAAPY
jgi:hypothetical protein